MSPQAKQPFYGWRNLVLLFICYCMMYGFVFYGFSVVFPAMVKAMGWRRGDAALGHTLRALLIAFGSPICAYMITRWGVQKTMLTGGALVVLGLALIGTVMTELWQWIVLWGLVVGLGLSLGGVVSTQTTITQWFTKYRGLAMGLTLTGAAVGGFIGQPLFTWIMRQMGDWRIGWISAGICALIGTITIIWLKSKKPAQYGQYPDGIAPEEAKASAAETGASAKPKSRVYKTDISWTLGEALRTRHIYMLIFLVLMQIVPLYFLVTHGVFHMVGAGLTRMQAAYVMSFYVLGGAFARAPVGWLADKIEGRWLLSFFYILIVGSMFAIWQAPGLYTLAAAACVFGVAYGAAYIVCPVVVGNYFGSDNFHKILSFMFPIEYGIGAIVPAAAGYVYDFNKTYDPFFYLLMALGVLAVFVAFATTPPKRTA